MNEDSKRSPRKRIWIVAAMVVVVAITVPWLLKDRLEPLTLTRLEAAQGQWQQSGIEDYELEIEVSGAESGRYNIAVRGGRLERIVRDGQPANPAQGEYWTVEGLFRTIEEELYFKEHSPGSQQLPAGSRVFLLARFDLQLGYPRKFVRQITGTNRGIEIEVYLTRQSRKS